MIRCSNKYQFKHYPYWSKNWCVYFLHFGNHYYIGATNKLVRRIQAHECTINSVLAGNYSKLERHVSKIVEYIKNNGITEYYFTIYADCYDSNIANLVEKVVLQKYFLSSKCLNISKLSLGLGKRNKR